MLQPDTLLDERFEIHGAVAAGGMGQVYRARDRATGEAIAIKVLATRGEADAERFAREAAILAGLEHPHIVRYIAHGRMSSGEPYLAMEWLDGETLESRLATVGLPPDESVQAVRRIALALGEIHRRGLVHRDVKPANLILPGGDLSRVTLIDFGIARGRNEIAHLTRTGVAIGTLGYMAPEQARADRKMDARVDVFALGCVLFECLTGQAPFQGTNPLVVQSRLLFDEAPPLRALLPEAPAALEALLHRMLARSRELRPTDGAALAAELTALGPLGGPFRRATSAAATPEELPTEPRPVGSRPEPPSTAACSSLTSIVVTSLLGNMSVEDAPTIELADLAVQQDALQAGMAPFAARVEILADGTVVAVISGPASGDHGARAARCALEMRARLSTPIALLTSRRMAGAVESLGVLLERGARAAALQAARARRHPPTAADAILIDEETAALLGNHFMVRRDKRGVYLLGGPA